jgi:hypothetical protein
MQAATLLGQVTAQLTDDPKIKSVIDQMSQLVEMQAGGGQGPGDLNRLLSQLTKSGEGSGMDLNIISDFVKACESGETLEAATLLGRATAQLTDDPGLKTLFDQMTRLVEMQAGGGQGVTIERSVAEGGFGASRGRSTGGTRQRRESGGFRGTGQPEVTVASTRWEVPPEIEEVAPVIEEPEELPPLTGVPEGQTVFKGIAPGHSLSGHIREHLGKPETKEKDLEVFEAKDKGVAEATVAFGPDHRVRWARIRLAHELDPELARIAFRVSDPAPRSKGCAFREGTDEGWTEHHASAGVHLYIRGGVVREVWMVRPGEDPAAVKRNAESALGGREQ